MFDIEESEPLDQPSRRPTRRSLYHAARKGNASLLAEKFGLTVEELVSSTCKLVPAHVRDEPLLPEECARDFIELSSDGLAAKEPMAAGGAINPLPGELRSTSGALAAAREWYAHALAASLDLRRAARSHFAEAARLTTEATPKGMAEIDAAHPLYRVVAELCVPSH